MQSFKFKGNKHSRSSDSSTLPLSNSDTRSPPSRFSLTRRCTRLLVGLILVCLFLFFSRTKATVPPSWLQDQSLAEKHSLPPLYEEYHDYERHLPQHNLSLPFPEGRDAKFFWAANHVTSSGWGNAMQELVMNAVLAHATKRAFVFDNFTWERNAPDYSTFNGKLIPSRIPLSAIIGGPIIGSSFPPRDAAPRAVSREYFKEVCPNPTIIDSWEVNEHLRLDNNVPALQIFDKWVEKLNSIDDPCVEIRQESFQLFEIWLFGSRRILSIWPILSRSPILTEFSWSPLVLQAYAENADLFVPTSSFRFLPSFMSPSGPPPPPIPTTLHDVRPLLTSKEMDPVRGLLALHIRRGDFAGHCSHLANWSSDWNGFNQFSALPDKFRVPTDGGWGETTEANTNMYFKACYPTIEQIVEKVRDVLADQRRLYGSAKELKSVYVMTNGDVEWLHQLKEALMQVKKWNAVVTSKDLKLNWEAKPVAQAVDMLIGQRAQVFIGNGFSSLTSNIVMLRKLGDLPPEDTRFWT
ncbi:hypothetical protein DEU56DRAFT_790022 [Suillus clintonianus]|uniref:uncharacterized protein n=1 Tax=Suillus clintonianus TaxID=1904413 RepID=UPI001B867DC0|nr:uncharacterized protein DEU56DRAFT_790022 [Suillus clintonianus]KAG2144520.1 hypothetical protein DEU56DRAFT_790022 [Suillus clintonianus]